MTPDAIKALRSHIGCTARALASALGVDQATVLAWERGDLFPTRRHVEAMTSFATDGKLPDKARPASAGDLRALADPALWAIVRKLCVHDRLREEVAKLASGYPDPAEERDGS